MSRLATDSRLRHSLGAAGRRRAVQHYSLEAFRRGLLRTLAATRTPVASGRGRFTRLGRALNRALGGGPGGARGESLRGDPQPPPYRPEHFGLHAALVAPYASRAALGRLAAADMLFVAPLVLRLGAWAESVDPLWPRRQKVSPGVREVLERLQHCVRRRRSSFVRVEQVVQGNARLARELGRAIELGLVFQSHPHLASIGPDR